jgi:serine/threonine-protein kinase
VGQVIAGRYRLDAPLDSGSTGCVFAGLDQASHRAVAVKVLHPHISENAEMVERFLREVSAASAVDHPGAVEVLDAGVAADGSCYLVMERLHGQSLRAALLDGHIDRARALELVRSVLEPLGAAHAVGIVHRDVKPENMFVVDDPGDGPPVKLLDFGIARFVEGTSTTKTGFTLGTPDYMSPEQAVRPREVTPAADVWSVGVLLYELLTGQLPFEGDTPAAVFVQTIQHPHRPTGELAPDLPPTLAAIVDACLQKDPRKRPADAWALRQALDAAMQQPITPRPITATPSADRSGPARAAVEARAALQREDVGRERPPESDEEAVLVVPAPRWPRALGVAVLLGLLVGAALAWRVEPKTVRATLRTAPPPAAPAQVPAARPVPAAAESVAVPAADPEPAPGRAPPDIAADPTPPDTAAEPARPAPVPRSVQPSAVERAPAVARRTRRPAERATAARRGPARPGKPSEPFARVDRPAPSPSRAAGPEGADRRASDEDTSGEARAAMAALADDGADARPAEDESPAPAPPADAAETDSPTAGAAAASEPDGVADSADAARPAPKSIAESAAQPVAAPSPPEAAPAEPAPPPKRPADVPFSF